MGLNLPTIVFPLTNYYLLNIAFRNIVGENEKYIKINQSGGFFDEK
jgi:hypothetical protein